MEVTTDEGHGMFSQQVYREVAVVMTVALQIMGAVAENVRSKDVVLVGISALPS